MNGLENTSPHRIGRRGRAQLTPRPCVWFLPPALSTHGRRDGLSKDWPDDDRPRAARHTTAAILRLFQKNWQHTRSVVEMAEEGPEVGRCLERMPGQPALLHPTRSETKVGARMSILELRARA
jgi:hypothetical protein